MRLQARLAITYLLLVVPTLALFGVAIYLIARAEIYRGVDESLKANALAVETLIEHVFGPLTPADIELSRPGLDRQAVKGHTFEILDPSGAPLYSSTSQFLELGPTNDSSSPQRLTLRYGTGEQRVLVQPIVRLGERAGFVATQTSLEPANRSLDTIGSLILASVAGAALLSVIPSYIVAGKGLQPVKEVAALAREIEMTADFTRRLPEAKTSDEMGKLTATFNSMVDRVERMLIAQSAFLADSSHELRRPLTLLRTNIDVMNNHPDLPEAEREQVYREMRREAELMSRLVADLLLLSSDITGTARQESVDMVRICQMVAETAQARSPEHSIRLDLPARCRVRGDRQRLAQVLENLVENATLYSPPGTTVQLGLQVHGPEAAITVLDDGPGMTDEDVRHAFERFYRGANARRQRREGSGLGLPIAKHIVEAHGGTVAIRSVVGAGTSVLLTLPMLDGPISAADREEAAAEGSVIRI